MKPISFVHSSPQASRENSTKDEHTNPLSLDAYFIQHPTSTFFVRVGRDVEASESIDVQTGDVLVVDRAAVPVLGRLALVTIGGELLVTHWGDTSHGQAECELWGSVVAMARMV